jgi:hypothetical protein
MVQRQYEHGLRVIDRHGFSVDYEQRPDGGEDVIGVALDKLREVNTVNDARGLLHDTNSH